MNLIFAIWLTKWAYLQICAFSCRGESGLQLSVEKNDVYSVQWQNLVYAAHFVAQDIWVVFFFPFLVKLSQRHLLAASSWWNDVPHVVSRKPVGFISHLHHSSKCLESARLSLNKSFCGVLSHSISNFQRWWRSAAAGQRLTFATSWRLDKLSAASSTEKAPVLSPLVLFNELCANCDGEFCTPGSEWRNIPDPRLPVIQKEEGHLHGLFSILNVSLFIIRDLFREGDLLAHHLDGPSFITRYFVVLVGWRSCTQSLHGRFTLCHTAQASTTGCSSDKITAKRFQSCYFYIWAVKGDPADTLCIDLFMYLFHTDTVPSCPSLPLPSLSSLPLMWCPTPVPHYSPTDCV